MDKLDPPKSLILTGNLTENWRRYKQQFEIYLIASGLDKKDGKVQAMALLHVAWKYWKCIIHFSGTQQGMMSKLIK